MLVLKVETLLLQIPHAAYQLASCANSIQSIGGHTLLLSGFLKCYFSFPLSTGRTSVTLLISGQRAIDLGSGGVHQQ
jgi:hypothetical protein